MGSLTLEAFNLAGVLIGSTTNGEATGPHGRTLATLDVPGIHSFRVSGSDTWGMDQIEFGALTDPPSVLTLSGPLFQSANEQRAAVSAFLDITDITIQGQSTDPLVWLTGSTLTTVHQFASLINAAVATAGSFLRLDNGAAIIQTGGVEPLVSMSGGTLTPGTGGKGHLFDLVGRARVSIPNDAGALVNLNGSMLNVTNGHLVTVAGGSSLNLAGSLLSLSSGSTLNILNGLVLNVTDNFAPTALIGGIPVYGLVNSFRIAGNALAGLGTAGGDQGQRGGAHTDDAAGAPHGQPGGDPGQRCGEDRETERGAQYDQESTSETTFRLKSKTSMFEWLLVAWYSAARVRSRGSGSSARRTLTISSSCRFFVPGA